MEEENETKEINELNLIVRIEKELIPFVRQSAKDAPSKNCNRWVNDVIRRLKALGGEKE